MKNHWVAGKALLPFPTIDLQQRVERVFDFLDVSKSTREDYKYRIGLFIGFIKKQGFEHNSFLEFKRMLADKTELSVATKNKYFATAKVFLKELNRQGILPMDVTQNVKAFSQDKKHKRDGLNEEEIARLVERVRSMPTAPQTSRLRAILGLLALQGLRQVEIVRLDVRDIDLVGRKAFVQGKGRDDREPIDLHPETVEALKNYLKSNKIADGPLFTSQSNNHRNKRLTTRSIRDIVQSTLKRVGIEKTVHGLRHFFATQLVKKFKGDLLEVSQYTRHRSLEMLQVYYDRIKKESDLPKFYNAFEGVRF